MKIVLSLVLASVAFAAGLDIFKKSSTSGMHAYLEVALENRTGEALDETAIVFSKNRCTSGILGIGATKSYMGWERPVGTNALVKWRDSKLTNREVTVSIVGIYNPQVDGRLTFTIMPTNAPTNVTVRFMKLNR